jgi:hypothetical protein
VVVFYHFFPLFRRRPLVDFMEFMDHIFTPFFLPPSPYILSSLHIRLVGPRSPPPPARDSPLTHASRHHGDSYMSPASTGSLRKSRNLSRRSSIPEPSHPTQDPEGQPNLVPRRRGREPDLDLKRVENEPKRRRTDDHSEVDRRIPLSVHVPPPNPANGVMSSTSTMQIEATRTYSTATAQLRIDVFILWLWNFSCELFRPQESPIATAEYSFP